MSLWFEVIGWTWVALGVYTTWRDGRPLWSRAAGRGGQTRQARSARRQAWRHLGFSVFWVVIGVGWVTNWHEHWLFLWLNVAYLVTLVSRDLISLRSRRRRKSGGQAPATR